ncbi:MAG: carbohydrate kinase [Lachnospiraceae bacterium]|nr:carbohydrate kinase [Lachnospiraceae bacterium]
MTGRKTTACARRNYDVVALGELLIDFTEAGTGPQGNPLWEANPGGAPCNVLAMLAKLGHRTAFIGKVGQDVYGEQLRNAAAEAGICTDALLTDPDVHTTLAVVHRRADGDRDFSFYRNPGADMMLRKDEVPPELLSDTRIFHFGTLSMTHRGVRGATKAAVRMARKAGALLSFDPNLRPPLWASPEDARTCIDWGLQHCDILKISDGELFFMTGETDFDCGAAMLQERYPKIRLMNVTAGPDGSHCYYGTDQVFVPAFRLGGTVDTTGAGDTFCACVLHHVLASGLEHLLMEDRVREMLRFANAAAYLVTTKKGALRSMPDRAEIERILE